MSCPRGKVRSRSTGYCRKPCARHQAINPETGKCVTKNYLRRIQRESRGRSDRIYSIGSAKDYRDGLVPDPACYPRKRNIYTGYCKTPCGPGRAINPATGNCVTLRYLRMLNPEDYDTDGDDEMAARVLFTPTDLSTKPGIISAYNENGLQSSEVTDNDLIVMRAAVSAFDNAYTVNNVNNREMFVCGVYNPSQRKDNLCRAGKAIASAPLTKADHPMCGMHEVGPRSATELAELITKNTNIFSNVFLFAARSTKTIPSDLLGAVRDAANTTNVRLLFAGFYGVWRILVPKVDGGGSGLELDASMQFINTRMMEAEHMAGSIDSRKLAHDVHEILEERNNMHLSFAPYPLA